MENYYWNWVTATTRPEKNTEIMMAIPTVDGEAWLYVLGVFYEEGDVFVFDGKETEIGKVGYYFYSERYERLLPVETIKYWTYIEAPSDIADELIIMRNDQL